MRKGAIIRKTKETSIEVGLDLDGSGLADVTTGIGFFDHMLDQLARHSLVDIKIRAEGDRHIDDHHTVEDVGIALGQALAKALGDKRGLTRYADCLLPMDETLTRVALDVSGRPFLIFRTEFPAERIGAFDTELVREFFQAFASNCRCSPCTSKRFTARTAITSLNRALKASPARFAARLRSIHVRPSACHRPRGRFRATCHERRHCRLWLGQPALGAEGLRARSTRSRLEPRSQGYREARGCARRRPCRAAGRWRVCGLPPRARWRFRHGRGVGGGGAPTRPALPRHLRRRATHGDARPRT